MVAGADNSANAENEQADASACDRDSTCSGNGECNSDGTCSCNEGFSGDDCGTLDQAGDNMDSSENVDAAVRAVKLAAAQEKLREANVEATQAASAESKANTEAERAAAAHKTAETALTGQGGLEDKMAEVTREAESTEADRTRAKAAFEAGEEHR